jgi:hypothetical protein
MKDLVYILGTGSKWQDNEIRFSLRSVTKNLTGVGNVWIIGELPCFIDETKVKHLYYPDRHSKDNADANMIDKLLHACQQPELSDDFIFMNDDFFILKPMHVDEIPLLHKGDMKDKAPDYWAKTDIWTKRILNTFNTLKAADMTTMLYDLHCPMPMNKTLFPAVMEQFDYATIPGLNFRSLYGNAVYQGEGTKNGAQKFTVFMPTIYPVLIKKVKLALFMAVNDFGLNIVIKGWLRTAFNRVSAYEHDREYLIKIGRNCNEFS